MEVDSEMYDVAVVGYGPVGGTLAALLANVGLSVVILEKEPSVFHHPRAGHIDGEVMRVFQSIGVAGPLKDKAHRNPGMEFRTAEGDLLLDWPRPKEIGPEGWYPSYHCHQPDMETALREVIADKDNVDVLLRCEVISASQDEHGVTLDYVRLDEGGRERVRARYVVGCDGARSTIRKQMQVELADLKSHQQWLVLDLMLKQPRADLPLKTIQWCDPDRPMTMAGVASGRRRWEIMLMPGEAPEAIAKPEAWWPLIARWVKPEEANVDRSVVYTFHSVIAESWRKGRMLLAGDACHQTPPFMGQGMCAGIRDAANLYWKLKAVIADGAPAALLDTYQSERLPHVRTFIETAIRLGGLIHVTDPVAAKERDERLRRSPEFMITPAPALGPGLCEASAAPAGLRSRQIIASGLGKLDDQAPHRFYVLLREAMREETGRLLARRDVPVFGDTDPGIADYLDEIGADAVVIRPDRYVLAVANSPQEVIHSLSGLCRSEPLAA
jgi:3-(3-hydroxy-phenyl)propionate hydroxylase